MVSKELFIILLLHVSIYSASEYRSGFRNRKENNHKNRETKEIEGKVKSPTRQEKLFSLFSIVQFKNEGCQSTQSRATTNVGQSKYRNGTCYTAQECSDRGGAAYGGCAAGFGTCCVFTVSASGSTITQNCTYIRNPGYPNNYGETTAASYTIQKCSCNVCTLRLDFESFTTYGLTLTTEVAAVTCQDTFTVTGIAGNAPPTICGENTGQHIYVDMGASCSDNAMLNFNFATTTGVTRAWEIKVTQVECGSRSDPDSGCLQYHTGITGRMETFNFPATQTTAGSTGVVGHLPSQQYSVCIRQEEGYCCVEYQACRDETNAFTPGDDGATNKAALDNKCTEDYVGIAGGGFGCTGASKNNKFCGYALTQDIISAPPGNIPICDCTRPFKIDIVTDATDDGGNAVVSRGVCLEWTQIPC